MQLDIKDFAKIKEASINIDGITVIAGENNTGKSTIGKIIFSIFNSMYNMNQKVMQEREDRIYQIVSLFFQSYLTQNKTISELPIRNYTYYSRKFTEKIMNMIQNNNNAALPYLIENFIFANNLTEAIDDINDFIDNLSDKLNVLIDVSDKKVMTEVITRWFNKVFENQISPLTKDSLESIIELTIQNKKINLHFQNDTCISWNTELNILHEAFYIDNPFVIDSMSDYYFKNSIKITDSHLLKYLCKKDNGILDGIFDAVMVKDKLNEIYNLLGELLGGDIIENQDGQYYLKTTKYNHPLNIKNLSTGLKSFAIIKQLLEKGSLKEKDILILDEPEIHLHPEWQLLYAELIVLLQKKFDLTIIITTHSPYFLDAIDVFTAKHKISDKTNYYLAENNDLGSYLYNVTNNIDKIYKKLSDPMQELENIRQSIYTF
ncbi:AAA family ATPase [Velocimicrobium porci]|uniref:AAA family ATPase n=1 Tax=Velocimicrobium porci TaxID=2606634 RepID=A0A6L5Y2C1_9FIRM|nr:AAA family ATPase [Velocimicrobium porci]MSS64911.1 AAA family ATPase [Velocimicrobium porci]